jgi:hypothetical protein
MYYVLWVYLGNQSVHLKKCLHVIPRGVYVSYASVKYICSVSKQKGCEWRYSNILQLQFNPPVEVSDKKEKTMISSFGVILF